MRMQWSSRIHGLLVIRGIDYMVSYPPKVTYGSAFGGGGSGIGGIKSTMEIHEFCIVRSLKLCSFLGCKWGVPLVIGGGGGGGWGGLIWVGGVVGGAAVWYV